MKPLSSRYLIGLTGAIVIFVIGLLAVSLWRQGQVVDRLIRKEIERNNMTTSDFLADPVTGSLKPQIINVNGEKKTLNLPESFSIDVLASGFESPEHITLDSEENIFISDRQSKSLILLPAIDRNNRIVIDSNLPNISGIAWHNNSLYVLSNGNLYVYEDLDADGSYLNRVVLIDDLPKISRNQSSSLLVMDERIFVSIPAKCESCRERDPRRASLLSFALDGSDEKLYAKGLYEIGALALWQDTIIGTDLSRNGISDELPPSEINQLVEGKDYGWPFCYGQGIPDPVYPQEALFCQDKAENPILSLPAHINPRGLAMIPQAFLPEFPNQLMISYAGEDDLAVPQGFKVVAVNLSDSKATPQNFITGWLNSDGSYWGRPQGMVFVDEAELIITDSEVGVVYRVSRSGLE